jgi:hypothetical protein
VQIGCVLQSSMPTSGLGTAQAAAVRRLSSVSWI